MNRLLLSILLSVFLSTPVAAAEQSMTFARFGTITLYGDTDRFTSVALFVSGDGGWNKGVIDMARSLAGMQALVVGIDIRHYLAELAKGKEKCSYPAADFEAVSKYVQKRLGKKSYLAPVLVGYSSGATLVYATLAQAPPGTFLGAISMGFCPDLPIDKPFCTGYGLQSARRQDDKGYDFLPSTSLKAPWVAFQGDQDQVCDAKAVQAFVGKVDGGRLVLLPKVGHGFAVQKNWLPQFRKQYADLSDHPDQAETNQGKTLPAAQSPSPPASPGQPVIDSPAAANDSLDDLPLVELPGAEGNQLLAVIITGDGGWAAIDRSIGETLAEQGIGVVGLNSLKYFWNVKTPEQSAKDLQRIIDHYLTVWRKSRVLLIGYSQGADVMPFMVSRLSRQAQDTVVGIALLGLAKEATFEVSVSGWLGGSGSSPVAIAPEIGKLARFKILCIYGREEDDTFCRDARRPIPLWQSIEMSGGHHFDNDFVKLTKLIMAHLQIATSNTSNRGTPY
jgi:type IV secretory pathway VirJ component